MVVAVTGESYAPLERLATPASSALTIIGAILTAISIYMYSAHPHKPDSFSWYCSAPATILAGAVALAVLYTQGFLSVVVVNGFSLLGISGGLLRTQPKPSGWPR
jgi:uncharacterized membrane protein